MTAQTESSVRGQRWAEWISVQDDHACILIGLRRAAYFHVLHLIPLLLRIKCGIHDAFGCLKSKSLITLGADLVMSIIVLTEVNWVTLQLGFVSESSPHKVGLFGKDRSLAHLLRVRRLESEDDSPGKPTKQESKNECSDGHFNYNYNPSTGYV